MQQVSRETSYASQDLSFNDGFSAQQNTLVADHNGDDHNNNVRSINLLGHPDNVILNLSTLNSDDVNNHTVNGTRQLSLESHEASSQSLISNSFELRDDASPKKLGNDEEFVSNNNNNNFGNSLRTNRKQMTTSTASSKQNSQIKKQNC